MSQPPPPASPAPAKSGNRVLVIILCVVLGFVLLVGGCVSACVYLTAKKAREYSRTAQKNPVYASLIVAAALLPDVEVVSKDEAAGKITVRNKRTGEIVTINSNDYTKENVDQAIEKMTAGAKAAATTAARAAGDSTASPAGNGPDSENQSAHATGEPKVSSAKAEALAEILRKFPDYLPAYPGGTTLEASQNALGGIRSGNYVFLTSDKTGAVVDFYEQKATAAGFAVAGRSGDTNDFGSTASLNLVRTDPPATITVSAEGKAGGRVQVSIAVSETGK
jgi:hypothetical protein